MNSYICIEKDCDRIVSGKNRRCVSCAKKGERNSFYGKTHSKETIEKLKKNLDRTGLKMSEEQKRKIGESNKIALKKFYDNGGSVWNKNVKMTEETRIKLKEAIKNKWKDKDYREKMLKIRKTQWTEETKIKILKALSSRKKTGLEIKLENIINKYKLPFKYVGDASFILHGLCPDFIHNKEKKLIEVFYEYFKEKQYGSVENYKIERHAIFKKYGFDTLFIDGDFLLHSEEEEVAKRIYNYHVGGGEN